MRTIKFGPMPAETRVGLPITLNGKTIGRITEVRPDERGVMVTAEVEDDIELGTVLDATT